LFHHLLWQLSTLMQTKYFDQIIRDQVYSSAALLLITVFLLLVFFITLIRSNGRLHIRWRRPFDAIFLIFEFLLIFLLFSSVPFSILFCQSLMFQFVIGRNLTPSASKLFGDVANSKTGICCPDFGPLILGKPKEGRPKETILNFCELTRHCDFESCVQIDIAHLVNAPTLRYATLRYSTLRYATLLYSTLRYSTIL
jgi:hypothetical protein